MPRKVSIPPRLRGTAFLTRDVNFHRLGPGRLRGRGVEHPFRGIATVGLDQSSVLEVCRAYEPLLGQRQFFSHLTSAALFGIPLPASMPHTPLHVSAIDAPTSPRRVAIRGHVLKGATVRTGLHFGLPVVSAADTWFQLATMLTFEDLVAAGDYLITGARLTSVPGGSSGGGSSRGPALVTRAELRQCVARHAGSRGAIAAASAIVHLRFGVDSRPETHLRLLLVNWGIPEPEVDVPTLVDAGRLVFHADLTLAQYRVVFEYEGDEHRLSKTRFRADIRRRELFEAAGWRVIRVTADDLYTDPLAFIMRVRAILTARTAH